MKKYLLLIWIFAFQALQAQVFPVQVTPQLIPPYSLNLSDYQNAAREQVIVNLLLSDVTESNREVTLKFSMSNTAGFAIESAPVVVGALPVFLNGGIPLRLTNADLQAYFQLQNLRGISPQQYGQPLPDGVYQFCFEVFDRRSGQAISRKSCATAFLVLNDPPFLNVPSRGEAIPQKEPQNIVFQWTPRHLNATNVEYEFTLVEVWDELVDPQTAFLASRPYYQTSTRATTLLYGPGEPALLPDKNYAWRVRAVINDGISQTSVFKNNGYSEIYYFEHNAECAPPLFAISESKTATTQNIRWQQALYQGYNVQYRKKKAYTQTNETKETKRKGKKRKKNKGSKNASYSGIKAVDGGSPWFEIKTFSEQATIFNLEKATTYEFRVGGRCRPNGGFAYGNIQEFTTASSNDQASGYQCGILPNIQINNQEPLERLGVNEVFTAGDFPVTVKFIAQGNRVSGEPGSGAPVLGANGTYSGWGFITVPYLADTRIKVIFNNIKLNSDYQLIEGVVETDYDKDWGDVDDISDELEVLEDVGVWTIDTVSEFVEIIKDKLEKLSPEKKAEVIQKIEQLEELVEEEPEKVKELVEEIKEIISEDPPPTDTDTPEVDVPESEDEGEGEPFISFRDEKYKDGDSIKIKYDNSVEEELLEFFGAAKTAKIVWDRYATKNTEVASSIIGEGKKVSHKLMGDVSEFYIGVQYWNDADNFPDKEKMKELRVKVEIAKNNEFKLEELYATDGRSKKRIAKSNETLYLVKVPGITSPNDRKRLINYSITTSPSINKNSFNKNDIVWNYNNINGERKFDYGKVNITRSLWEREEPHVTAVEAGEPKNEVKNVEVVFVDGEIKTFEFMPPAISSLIKDKLMEIEKNLKVLDKINNALGLNEKTKFKIDPIRVSSQKYNEEDSESRLYKIFEKASVTAGVKAEMAEVSFTHPVFKLAERAGIFQVGAYLMFKVQAQVKGGVERYKFVEENIYKGKDPYLKIISKGCIETGLRSKLLVAKNQVDFDVKGYAEGCLAGEYKYSFKDEKIKGLIYIPPVILAAHIKIKSKGFLKFDLVDWRGKIEVSDRIEL
ncbi:hypothetical protein [Aquimarina agarilytica]|uniref:hypothetical protein n=1 Tax=Aquimarina agarilytica TaxID=1087449 RepID=UPI00028937A0|nr:hypothetical protein [Aquimarina agarilytica]